jgi:cell division protein FtsZ
LFEVDQSVNKIRAEVDPEAELIFGAIKDENMTGKIRVSIVATALDGHKTENKTVLNMFSRAQNRNTGHSENLFSQNSRIESNPLNSIDGATALKLDESYQLEEQEFKDSIYNVESQANNQNLQQSLSETKDDTNNLPSGLSIESASYMENNNLAENINTDLLSERSDGEEEYTPKLFSEEHNHQVEEKMNDTNNQSGDTELLFDQDINEEDDFEIPAFLRKQKF